MKIKLSWKLFGVMMFNVVLIVGVMVVIMNLLVSREFQRYDYAGYDRIIDTHIKNLRKKLQTFGLEAAISSVYGVGYRFQIPN